MPKTQRGTKASLCHNRKALLLYEAKRGNKSEVERLLRAGKLDIDVRDEKGKTPLMLAMEGSHDSTVVALFQFHPNIHAKNNFGKSALHAALKLGLSKREIISLFLNVLKEECNSDSDQLALKLMDIQCPMYLAALLKDAKTMRAMLEKGCTVNAIDSHTLKTALHVAFAERDFKTIKVLLDYGADVNATDLDGHIPFDHYHSFDDSVEELNVLKAFVERVTSWTARDRYGSMQIQVALLRGKKEALRILLKCDIDWCATDSVGFTPLSYLAMNRECINHQDLFENLRNKKIYDSSRGWTGIEVLRFVASHNLTNLVEMLLDSGVNPNTMDNARCTPLFRTARFRYCLKSVAENKKTFMLLLQRGADLQIICFDNLTVFDAMIEFGSFHLAESALGQLAINESLGTPITGKVRETIYSHEILKDQYLSCKKQLEELKNIEVRNSVTVYALLTGCERALAVYARNKEFSCKWKGLNDICTNSYYAYVLETKLEKTMRLVELRNDTASIVCDVMGIEYDSYPAVVDTIVDYVIF